MTQGRYNIVNAVTLNVVWMAAVGGAARGWWWAGPAAALAFLLVHRPYFNRMDALILIVLMPLGLVLDSLYAATGVVIYASPVPSAYLAPVWILALWLALTVAHSLRFLLANVWVAMLLGAIFGPLSYWIAAEVWGAAEFGYAWPVWVGALAIPWLLVMGLCSRLLKIGTEGEPSRAGAAAARGRHAGCGHPRDGRRPVADRDLGWPSRAARRRLGTQPGRSHG